MTYEEYETKLNAIVKDPDSAPIAVQEILKELKTDSDTLASVTADNTAKDERIRSLQDTNTKLFLQITGKDESGSSAESWEDMTGDEALNAFIDVHNE